MLEDEAHLARLRQGLLRFHASAFLAPEARRLEQLTKAGRGLLDDGADRLPLAGSFGAFVRLLEGGIDPLRLAGTHSRLFQAAPGRVPCPPYGCEYLGGSSAGPGAALAELDRFYGDLGIALRGGAAERSDHVAVELEVLSLLAGEEATALEAGDDGTAKLVRGAARPFVRGHILGWIPAFRMAVREHDADGIYAHLADATYALVHEEHAILCAGLREAHGA